jgi:hypothetical protein
VPERVGQDPVDVLQQVVDVGPAGGRLGPVQLPVGVGGADDPVAAPGITNSTLFSVLRISPVPERIRAAGTMKWMPLDMRTRN